MHIPCLSLSLCTPPQSPFPAGLSPMGSCPLLQKSSMLSMGVVFEYHRFPTPLSCPGCPRRIPMELSICVSRITPDCPQSLCLEQSSVRPAVASAQQ